MLGVVGEPELDSQPAVAAFEDLLMSCSTPAFQLAHTMLGDAQEAEDAVQEAAVKAWTRFGQFRRDASFRTWFMAIVANQCLPQAEIARILRLRTATVKGRLHRVVARLRRAMDEE